MARYSLPMLMEQAVGALQAESAAKGMAFERVVRSQRQPSCQPRCDHCCYHPLEIGLLEAIPIYRHLVSRGRWTPALTKLLEGHAEKVEFQAVSIWLLLKIPCPLLIDHRCSVYEVRPFQCRATWSLGDPYYCQGQNFSNETALVARDGVMADFIGQQQLLGKQVDVSTFMMPVSRALLLAAEVVTGQLDPSQLMLRLASLLRVQG